MSGTARTGEVLNLCCVHCTEHHFAGQYQHDTARHGCAIGHTTKSCWICPAPPSPLAYPTHCRPNEFNSHRNIASHYSKAAAVWKNTSKPSTASPQDYSLPPKCIRVSGGKAQTVNGWCAGCRIGMSERTLQHFWPGWAVSPGANTTDQVRKAFMQTKMVTCQARR